MEERKYFIYIHEFPNGKVYIGMTCARIENRWRNGKGYWQQPYVYNAINKYGWDNIIHDILEFDLTREEACKAEKYWISCYDSTNPVCGYNIDEGGYGGNPLAEETRRKISEGNKGKYVSQETREKLRKNMLGENNPMYGMCGELNPFYGKRHTEETRLKLSEKAKGKRTRGENPSARPVVQLDLDGNYIDTFLCIKDASEKTCIPVYVISRDCRHLVKKHTKYKFIWMYLDEYKGGGL